MRSSHTPPALHGGGNPPNWAVPGPGRQGAPHHHHPLDASENHSQAGRGSNWGWWGGPVRVVIEGWESPLPLQGPALNVPALSLLLIHLTSWSRTLAVSSRESRGQGCGGTSRHGPNPLEGDRQVWGSWKTASKKGWEVGMQRRG